MYIPSAFQMNDAETLHAFIRENSFAILVSQRDGAMSASHIPLLLDVDANGAATLWGHVARANTQWQSGGEALAIFHGPHAYVSPTWYGDGASVPTWNYAAVHAYGTLALIESKEESLRALERLVAVYESSQPAPWKIDRLDALLVEKLLGAIVAFRMDVTRLEGKWKLNQNRTRAAQEGVVAALTNSASESERQIAAMMRKNLER